MRALVTDAHYQNSLAAVRNLGKRGVTVISASHERLAQSFLSKYCSKKIICPKPSDENDFVAFVKNIFEENIADVIIPVGYDVTVLLSKHLGELPRRNRVPVADWKNMQVACHKGRTLELAEKIGIPTPVRYRSPGEVDKFPVVVKESKGAGHTRYVNTPAELKVMHTEDAVIQEYIPGEGYGFFALFNHGNERALSMHKRIREFPSTGGQSTCAMSVRDAKLEELGLKMLKALDWHGVAMVEFKKDARDGQFKLMEVNPKFWGSLDLAIVSGVEFPYLLAKMSMEGDITPINEYKTGVKFRWIFPSEILHLIENPNFAPEFLREFFDKDVQSNIDLSDFGPNVLQILGTPVSVINKARHGGLRNPHGLPAVIR